MYGLRSIRGSWNLRVSEEAELEGIDRYCHGLPAYHMEFGQGFSYSHRRRPTGCARRTREDAQRLRRRRSRSQLPTRASLTRCPPTGHILVHPYHSTQGAP